jgi:hypothetical protein
MIFSLSSLGYPICDTNTATPLYNNNEACVKWCHNMTTKGNHHMNKVKTLFGSGLPTAHSLSCISVGKQILPSFSPKKCAMMQTSDTSEILSCAAQAITTSAPTVLLATHPCLCKPHSILHHLVLAFSRFSFLTTAFIFRRPSPVFQALATISYLVLHPLSSFAGSCEQSYGGCSYVVYSCQLLLT